MKAQLYGALLLGTLFPLTAYADFQYQETTQMTGGSMLGMMKMTSVFNSRMRQQANAPIVSTIYVQKNRMARISSYAMEIVDLDKETVTNVDLQKHTYTVMTFQQMRENMERAAQKAREQQAQQKGEQPQAANDTDVQFKINVRDTGATKQVSGLDTHETILTMQMVGTDRKTGQQGAFAMTNDMWLASDIPGYEEARAFYQRFAAKMGTVFSGSGISAEMAAMQPAMSQGMSDMVKEVSKMKGIPILQVLRVGATANGDPLPAASEAPLPASSAPETPSAGDVAKQSAASALSSRLGGFGLGGFGRRKQPPQDNTAPADTQTAQPQAQTANVLMEMQTQSGGFSTAPIDDAKFSVPAGYRLVEPGSL